MKKILLLENDIILSQKIQKNLKDAGFDLEVAKEGENTLKKASLGKFSLYLLDVETADINGFDFLAKLREKRDVTPAFFITSLDDLGSLSRGYDTSIDNYIKKPFDENSLLVNIKTTISKESDFLDYGKFKYDALNKRVISKNTEINLTHVEKYIFDLLLRNLEVDITKEQFFEVMERPSEMALRVHINKLKHKLKIAIKNVRGIGYRLEKI